MVEMLFFINYQSVLVPQFYQSDHFCTYCCLWFDARATAEPVQQFYRSCYDAVHVVYCIQYYLVVEIVTKRRLHDLLLSTLLQYYYLKLYYYYYFRT